MVTGAQTAQITAALEGLECRILAAPDWQEGMAASLRAGLAVLAPESRGVCIFLGDMPLVPVHLCGELAARAEAAGYAARPQVAGKPGHPAAFTRAAFSDLMALQGDRGANRLLAERGSAVAYVETADAGALLDVDTPDDLAAAQDPELSRALDVDPAGIGRQSRYKTVYLLRDDAGDLDKVILPIHGYGLWSTLYGFIALEENGNDIFGLQFYQQGETPGLGAEVDNPRWKALWNGKKLFTEDGKLAITVAKSPPPEGTDYYVDALAGATLTSRGVDNLVRFWMGEAGYGTFLERLKAGEVD